MEESLSNIQAFPHYFNYINDVPNNDLTVPEYILCNKLKENTLNYSYSLGSFLRIHADIFKIIDRESKNYTPTESLINPNLFDSVIDFLKIKADEYTVELGEGVKLDPHFVYNLKKAYIENVFLQNDATFHALVSEFPQKDINKTHAISKPYVSILTTSILAGMVEKIANNFKRSEFLIGLNAAVVRHNAKMYDMEKKVKMVGDAIVYANTQCLHCVADMEKAHQQMVKALTRGGRFNADGTINYTGWIFKNRSAEEISRIEKVQRVGTVIINNAMNEIKNKLDIEKPIIYGVFFKKLRETI